MAWLTRLAATKAASPLPPMRPTADILSDIDHQVGRLSKVREQALAVIERVENDDAGT